MFLASFGFPIIFLVIISAESKFTSGGTYVVVKLLTLQESK